MPSLYWLARWASRNADATARRADQCKDPAGLKQALSVPLPVRLMDACRKNGPVCLTDKWEALFLALPERLLASLAYFVGNTKSDETRPAELPAGMRNRLERWRTGGADLRFANLDAAALAGIDKILLCHGLSPVEDSILLLADLGRASRIADALDLPVHVMLTAVEWQKANRSLKQIESLSDETCESGLAACHARRLKLYAKLGVTCHPSATDAALLKRISAFYQNRATELWQVNTTGKLSIDQQRKICSPLSADLEELHRASLAVLRFFARQFNGFDEEYFWYFFSQYFAQLPFKGNSLKVAVESETKFDQPFEELSELLAVWQDDTAGTACAGLSVVYLPQYMMGNLKVLPYSPLSLDVMKSSGSIRKDHAQLGNQVVLLDEKQNVETIARLLALTPLSERNRLVGDLTSFLSLCGRKLGADVLAQAAQLSQVSIEQTFATLCPEGWQLFSKELSCPDSKDIAARWAAGVAASLEDESGVSLPIHVRCMLLEEGDWTPDRLVAAASICKLASRLYKL